LDKALTMASQSEYRGAQALLAKAMEIDPAEPQVWKAFKEIEQDLLSRAETFLADGQLPRALREFQFVIKTNPESARGQNGVGLVLMQLKNYEEASQAFDRALVLDPGNARYRQAVNDARRLQKAASALEEKGKETVKGMLNEQPGKKR
jgi:tetratricopeptide (TPR) repeat protein